MQTMDTEREKETISATVNRPQNPNEILIEDEETKNENCYTMHQENKCYSLPLLGAWSQDVLTHGQEEEGHGNGSNDSCTDGKEHLHGVKEEEHDEEGDGCTQRQAECLHRIQCLYVVLAAVVVVSAGTLLLLQLGLLFHVQGSKGSVDNQEHGDEEGGDT